ncbi:hypothetical protein FGADI_2647 [Fusarium gaditjirri]|uniref:Rieske domain-containing protein n=1 Tax=Fusarium gaditjirri TaxID=282569 RepID=A0A8H4THR8_9HYPO|nr:hypothetical protein FGADI_2647 [Fusarium gaditjirri]
MNSAIFFGTTCALIAFVVLRFWRQLQPRDTSVISPEHRTFDLPEGWWSDPVRFQLERRAIFSQTWICVSHRGRFRSPGDYVVYEVAGFRILMILGKDMVVRSFHNVCRHRAFPVARKQSGSATVLGCRYHGWSYNTEGKLIKAPYFDDLPGFDKSSNSLFEVRTKQDSRGFLYINVSRDKDASATAVLTGLGKGELGQLRPESELVESIEFSGNFNWKVILNQSYASSPVSSGCHFRQEGPGSIGELLLFPSTTVHTMRDQSFWYQLIYSPVAIDQTNIRCDVYANSPKRPFKLGEIIKDSLQKEIQQKLLDFANQYMQLITSSDETIGNGDQRKIADAVEMHRRQEVIRGSEIKPAAFKESTGDEKLSKADRTNESLQQQTKSPEPPKESPSILALNPSTADQCTWEGVGLILDSETALLTESQCISPTDLVGLDSTNVFDQEFGGILDSITIETPTFDFSASDWLPDFCINEPSHRSSHLDSSQVVQLQPPVVNSDSSMRLLKCWFDEVCPAWSGFDSKSNMNRKMAEDLWQSSLPVSIALQSMSASFLSARLPQMRQSAMSLLKTATLSVQAELQELNEKNALDVMPTGIMFALICLGTTICWLDTRRVGWPFLQEAKTLLRWSSQQQFAADADKLEFFNKSLVYWDMLISFIYDPELDTDIHQVSALPSSFPRSDLIAAYSQTSYDADPHPWTGVSLVSSILFTRSIRLCRVYRHRTTERSRGALGLPPMRPVIDQAKELEVELLQLQLSPTPSLNGTNDKRTPATHLLRVAEAYQLASLLLLYIQFPTLLAPQSQLVPRDPSDEETTMLWHKRIIPLTLRLIEVLEQVPSESGSCAIQPLLYVCAATGLRYTPTLPLDTELSSGSPAKPRPMESILDYLDLLKDPLEHSKEDVDPLSVSQTAIDVSKGRAFILRRLSVFKECLHPGPIGVAEKLAKELWAAYDEAPRWSMDVCWISLMDKKDLRTMFG